MIFKDITFDLKYPNDDKPKISNNKTADKKNHTFTFLSAVFSLMGSVPNMTKCNSTQRVFSARIAIDTF